MIRNVIETGDYHADFQAGRECGAKFIGQLRRCDLSPFYLSQVSEGFGNRFGAVEKGFLAEICYTLIQNG